MSRQRVRVSHGCAVEPGRLGLDVGRGKGAFDVVGVVWCGVVWGGIRGEGRGAGWIT